MYSESDLDAAVTAGAMSPEAAAAFRRHVATLRQTPAVDEEQFRLLTGFNDIFVSIAVVLLLTAVAWIAQAASDVLAGPAVAAASWGLAEYFTRTRRMALPSIVLLIAFVGAIAATLLVPMLANGDPVGDAIRRASPHQNVQSAIGGVIIAAVAAVVAAAAWLHWRRFMVPITIAATALAVIGTVLALVFGLLPPARDAVYPLILVAGIGLFAFAMRWDLSDRERRTRRSDVAFWLHLAAAPMIAHALFHLLGVFSGDMNTGRAVLVLVLYVAFAVVALAVDRRALLVSSLAYVLYAMAALFRNAGAVELSLAFTGLVIGSALLLLSAFWQGARRRVVTQLGETLEGRLPPVQFA